MSGTELKPTSEVRCDGGSGTSHSSQILSLDTTTLCITANTLQISESPKSDKVIMPNSLPPLPSRGQPFPFILPEPLGPLSPPSNSSLQANSRKSTPGIPALLNTYSLLDNRTWGTRRVNPNQVGRFVMPNPTSTSTAEYLKTSQL